MAVSEGQALPRGERTRSRVLAAAERVFGERGYHGASIASITHRAGVAQGSFYLYFESKHAIFEELIRTRGEELRATLREAVRGIADRRQMEVAGFRAYFGWIAEHRHLYRVAHQADYVNPAVRAEWYNTFADGYAESLRRAMDTGQIPPTDPHVLAWSVMGMADFVAMRWVIWEEAPALAPAQLDAFIHIALLAITAGG